MPLEVLSKGKTYTECSHINEMEIKCQLSYSLDSTCRASRVQYLCCEDFWVGGGWKMAKAGSNVKNLMPSSHYTIIYLGIINHLDPEQLLSKLVNISLNF